MSESVADGGLALAGAWPGHGGVCGADARSARGAHPGGGGAQQVLVLRQLDDERVAGATHEVEEHVLLHVPVFIHEALHRVGDGAGVMLDAELRLPLAAVVALDKVWVALEVTMQICQVGHIGALKSISSNVRSCF